MTFTYVLICAVLGSFGAVSEIAVELTLIAGGVLTIVVLTGGHK